MKTSLMTLDKPNLNGRVYSTELMQKAISACTFPLPIERTSRFGSDTRGTVVGFASALAVEDGEVLAECDFLTDTMAELVRVGAMHVVSAGLGTVGPDGKVQGDYELTYLFLTDDPA